MSELPAASPRIETSSSPSSSSPRGRSFDEVAHVVASRFRAPSAFYYVRTKLRMDPIARALFELGSAEPLGVVADVACGRGQLALLLLDAELAERIVGFDWDAGKVKTARSAAAGLATARFEHGDVRETELSAVDTVLLVDILHYLTREEQDALLVRSARAARRRVVVRDVDTAKGAASVFTQALEWFFTSIGYNRGARVAPRCIGEIRAILEGEGFAVTEETCSARGMSNVLLVARR